MHAAIGKDSVLMISKQKRYSKKCTAEQLVEPTLARAVIWILDHDGVEGLQQPSSVAETPPQPQRHCLFPKWYNPFGNGGYRDATVVS
jgi:hypothetical protein